MCCLTVGSSMVIPLETARRLACQITASATGHNGVLQPFEKALTRSTAGSSQLQGLEPAVRTGTGTFAPGTAVLAMLSRLPEDRSAIRAQLGEGVLLNGLSAAAAIQRSGRLDDFLPPGWTGPLEGDSRNRRIECFRGQVRGHRPIGPPGFARGIHGWLLKEQNVPDFGQAKKGTSSAD